MEGYDYDCPICGSSSHSALSGLKFKQYLRKGKKLYICAWLNCISTLGCAKTIKIKDYDNIIKKFKYFYCVDNNHYKNQSKMMTVTLEITTWDSKTLNLPMKITYYNMLIYYKQINN